MQAAEAAWLAGLTERALGLLDAHAREEPTPGGQAVEGMARQPEAAGRNQTAALILAALIEGVALFGAVIAFQIQGKF